MFEKFKAGIAHHIKESRQKNFDSSICDLLDSLSFAAYDEAAFNDIVVNENFATEKNTLITTSLSFKDANHHDVKAVLKNGTLLHCAALTGNLDLLDKLVALGLDINRADTDGKKAIDYLVFPKHVSDDDKNYYINLVSHTAKQKMNA